MDTYAHFSSVTPQPSPLTPHASSLIPHSSFLIPHPSPEKKEHGGRLPLDRIAKYHERLAQFRMASWAAGVEVVQLEEWHGFALAVKHALELVNTPLICIVQHDLSFRRGVDLAPIVGVLLDENMPVDYVYFRRDSQRHYRINTLGKHKLELGPPVCWPTNEGSVPLTRLPRFFDGTHIARLAWYHGLFDRPLFHGKTIGQGQFIDTSLGVFMLAQAMKEPQLVEVKAEGAENCLVSQGVLNVCSEFGCWMWSGEEEPLIQHLNGRAMLSYEELELVKKRQEEAARRKADTLK